MFVIKNGRLIDPANNIDENLDILVDGERIKSVGKNLLCDNVIDVSGCIVVPGFVDVHTHLREPGDEESETFYTGSLAGAYGGFTTLIAQPNTNPRISTPELVKKMKELSNKSLVHIYPSACITKDHKEIVDIEGVKLSGAVKLTDDGDPVIYSETLLEALKCAKKVGIVVSDHCELSPWSEIALSTKNYELEPYFVSRDINLAKLSDTHIHFSHISTKKAIEKIKKAKKEGINVTCEVTPHHLLLTSSAVNLYGTLAKVNPPLRKLEDVIALREALSEDVIDIIATDHAPHPMESKNKDWEKASFGISGLDTAFSLIYKLVEEGVISLAKAIKKLTYEPAKIFNLPCGNLSPNSVADITVIDLKKKWLISVNEFKSKGKNSPFVGYELTGKPVLVIVSGKIVVNEITN